MLYKISLQRFFALFYLFFHPNRYIFNTSYLFTLFILGFHKGKICTGFFVISSIFFNILKNAFEAAEKTEEKKVEFIISYSGASLFIKLKNSALRQPVKKKGRYISDKEEEGHGYGLQNVCGCVERLGGEFGISYSEGEVVVDIIFFCALPVKDEKDTYRLDAESDQLPC